MLKNIGQVFQGTKTRRLWETCVPQDHYEVVILGGGSHGLACAYYLAKEFGVQRVAVLDQGELGAMESPWPTPLLGLNEPLSWAESVFGASQKIYRGMEKTWPCQVEYWSRAMLRLPQNSWDAGVLRGMVEGQRLTGGRLRFLSGDAFTQAYPAVCDNGLEGALYRPDGGVLRPASVAWGYAGLAGRAGVDLCPKVKVESLEISNGRIVGVWTDRGRIRTDVVVNAAADWGLALGVEGLENALVPMEYSAWVSAEGPTVIDAVMQCGALYVGQGTSGAWYMGGGTAGQVAKWVGTLMPSVRTVEFLHHWVGLGCRSINDWAGTPLMGPWMVDGLFVDLGWGRQAFEGAPVCGRLLAAWIAGGQQPVNWPGWALRPLKFVDKKE